MIRLDIMKIIRSAMVLISLFLLHCPEKAIVKDNKPLPNRLRYCYNYVVYQGASLQWSRVVFLQDYQYKFYMQENRPKLKAASGPLTGGVTGVVREGTDLHNGTTATHIGRGLWCAGWYAGTQNNFQYAPLYSITSADCRQYTADHYQDYNIKLRVLSIRSDEPLVIEAGPRTDTCQITTNDTGFSVRPFRLDPLIRKPEQNNPNIKIRILQPTDTRKLKLKEDIVFEIQSDSAPIEQVRLFKEILPLIDGSVKDENTSLQKLSPNRIKIKVKPYFPGWGLATSVIFIFRVKLQQGEKDLIQHVRFKIPGPPRYNVVLREKNNDTYTLFKTMVEYKNDSPGWDFPAGSVPLAYAVSPEYDRQIYILKDKASSALTLVSTITNIRPEFEYNFPRGVIIYPHISWKSDNQTILLSVFDASLSKYQILEFNFSKQQPRVLFEAAPNSKLHKAVYANQSLVYYHRSVGMNNSIVQYNPQRRSERVLYDTRNEQIKWDISEKGELIVYDENRFVYFDSLHRRREIPYAAGKYGGALQVHFVRSKIAILNPRDEGITLFSDIEEFSRYKRPNIPKPTIPLHFPNHRVDYRIPVYISY